MPGHVKLGAGGGEDPDPTPFLVVSMEMKREAMAKPYDSKKSVWCPDGAGGFSEAMLENDDGKKATVMVGHEVILQFKNFFTIINLFRKKLSSLKKLGKLIPQSLKSVRIWLT